MDKNENRVILLGKALILNDHHYKTASINGINSPLVSLGYFDTLQIYPLPKDSTSDNWLQDLWEHSIKLSGEQMSDVYYHPLYITLSPDRSIPNGFWDYDTQFMFVTLLHFSLDQEPPNEDTDRFAIISNKIASFVENSTPEVFAACYQSINLSDMVVIWKSDSLLAIMEKLNLLYQYNEIGDLRTTCSFPLSENHSPQMEAECIPYVSFRFGVSSAKEAFRFDDLMHARCDWWPTKPGGYFTTGAEDLNYIFLNLPTSKFLDTMSLWFGDQDINACFQRAFYESYTHLGISNQQLPSANEGLVLETGTANSKLATKGGPEFSSGNINTLLAEKCVQLFEEFQRLRALKVGELHSWYKPVSSQLSALVNMSRICVLDGFCYLILDGVSVFCKKISPYFTGEQQASLDMLGRIQHFIRGWGTLVDQALRVDGQFMQSPGFSPLLYDIPVNLLEFYLAFTKRGMNLMQSPEAEANRHYYALFLLPKLCRRTKVQDIFQDPPPEDRLLYVDVPLDYIYNPQQILLQLFHEVAHYCGEEFRCRERRANYFASACAHLIIWYFELESKDTLILIYNDILAGIPEDCRLYMEYYIPVIRKQILTLLNSFDTFQKWQDTFLKDKKYSESERKAWLRKNTENYHMILLNRVHDLDDLSDDIERIRQFFEECYADVSMLFLLSPTWEEYLSVYRQELLWMQEGDYRSQYAELVQRAAIVLLAVDRIPDANQYKDDPIMKQFAANICALYDSSRDNLVMEFEEPVQIGYMPLDLLNDILSYLRECWEKMAQFGDANDELDNLQKIYNKVVREHCIGCEGYRQTLTWYERRLLSL